MRSNPDDLTPRELEVLRLLVRGYTDQQIGEALFITRGNASNHVSDILHKLGTANRAAAAGVAVARGLVSGTSRTGDT